MIRDFTISVSYNAKGLFIFPHLPHDWGWRKWWNIFTHCCKELANLTHTTPHFSTVSHYAYFKTKNLLYEIDDWEGTLESILPPTFTILQAQNTLEMLYVIAPFLLPHVKVKDTTAIVTLHPLVNFSFLLPYPIPHILYTDDLEQLLTTSPPPAAEVGADVVTVRYRGFLREMARHISDGFLLWMAYIVIYYATLENNMKLLTPPHELLARASPALEIFIEDDIITRRLAIIAENDSLPLDLRVIAARLYERRTNKIIPVTKEVRDAELLHLEKSLNLLLSNIATRLA